MLDARRKSITIRVIYFILSMSFLLSNVWAQEEAAKQEKTEIKKEQDQKNTTKQQSKTPSIIKPSEEISEDLSVSFPVDI